MTVRAQDRKPRVVNPTIPASLTKRRATQTDQKTWTEADHARRTCMHCKTAYKDAGGAWACEHHHEGVE